MYVVSFHLYFHYKYCNRCIKSIIYYGSTIYISSEHHLFTMSFSLSLFLNLLFNIIANPPESPPLRRTKHHYRRRLTLLLLFLCVWINPQNKNASRKIISKISIFLACLIPSTSKQK